MNAEQAVSEETLESLYNLNKHAKKYAELADKNYHRGKGATAKANSVKKKALYSVKSSVLKRIREDADELQRHMIDDRAFWCLSFGKWSFHAPTDELEPPEHLDVSETRELDEYEKDSEKEHSDRSLKESLLHIKSEFGIDANRHLEQEKVAYGHRRHFVGWEYLE